jgi:hypothetical protein
MILHTGINCTPSSTRVEQSLITNYDSRHQNETRSDVDARNRNVSRLNGYFEFEDINQRAAATAAVIIRLSRTPPTPAEHSSWLSFSIT